LFSKISNIFGGNNNADEPSAPSNNKDPLLIPETETFMPKKR